MNSLDIIIIDLLKNRIEFENSAISEMHFLSMINVVDDIKFKALLNILIRLEDIEEVISVLSQFPNNSPDSILIYNAKTINNFSYIVLIEDLEELYSFHKLLAIIQLTKKIFNG